MKIFKSFFVLALTALSFNLSAGNNPDGNLLLRSEVVEQNVVILHLINLQQEATRITIESLDGKTTYFQERVRHHNGYRRKINVENLADGRYIIQAVQNDQSKKQVMLVRDGEVQLSSVKG